MTILSVRQSSKHLYISTPFIFAVSRMRSGISQPGVVYTPLGWSIAYFANAVPTSPNSQVKSRVPS